MTGLLELLQRGSSRGFIAIVSPLTFDEQVQLQQALRDWEEEHGPFAIRITPTSIEVDAEPSEWSPPTTTFTGRPNILTRRQIEEALAECAGNQTRAAKLLGIARQSLLRRITELGLARPKKRL